MMAAAALKEEVRFIDGLKAGRKVLIFDNNIYHVEHKTKAWTTYKCDQSKPAGCRARVKLHKFNPRKYTFRSFEVIAREHSHGPSSEKIGCMEGVSIDKFWEDDRHNCLFCCDHLPKGHRDMAYLENLVPGYHGDGGDDTLRISLEDPVKNAAAFELLCNRLGFKWRRKASFCALPLCLKCQDLYQTIFHLQLQITELDKLIERHAEVIRDNIARSSKKMGGKQADVSFFRSLVLKPPGKIHGGDKKRVLSSPKDKQVMVEQNEEDARDIEEAGTCLRDPLKTESPDDAADLSAPPEIKYEVVKEEITHPLPEDKIISEDEFIVSEVEGSGDGGKVEVDDDEDSNLNPGLEETDGDGGDHDFIPENSEEDEEDDDTGSKDSDSDFEPESKSAVKKATSPRRKSVPQKYKSQNVKDRQYGCHLCPSLFPGQVSMVAHYKTAHPTEKRYSCKFCKRHFPKRIACIRHQNKHTGETPFKCDLCPKSYPDPCNLTRHKKIHVIHPHQCYECGKGFPSLKLLTSHRKLHGKNSLILCKTCGRTFRRRFTFQAHNERDHNGTAEHSELAPEEAKETLSSDVLRETLGVPSGLPVKGIIKCHLCWQLIMGRGKKFVEAHFRDKHPDHPGGMKSCRCGSKFKIYRDCYLHALRHSEANRNFKCDQCPQAFYTGGELKTHQSSHLPMEQRKRFVCDICGLAVTSGTHLAAHKKRHGDPERWICETCGKSYAEKKGLLQHTRVVHLGIRDHKCEVCGKAYYVNADLVAHMRRHTGDRPFGCPICGKGFGRNSDLKKHLQGHEKRGERKEGGKGEKMVKAGPTNKKRKKASSSEVGEGGGGTGMREETVLVQPGSSSADPLGEDDKL